MSLEREIRDILSKHAAPDSKLFESLIAGSEAAVAAEDLLGIILKQDAIEQALLRIAEHVDRL